MEKLSYHFFQISEFFSIKLFSIDCSLTISQLFGLIHHKTIQYRRIDVHSFYRCKTCIFCIQPEFFHLFHINNKDYCRNSHIQTICVRDNKFRTSIKVYIYNNILFHVFNSKCSKALRSFSFYKEYSILYQSLDSSCSLAYDSFCMLCSRSIDFFAHPM